MPHLEAAVRFSRRILDLDVFNPRIGRAMPKSLDHSLDSILVAAEMRLNRAVRAISNPAADAQLARLTLGPDAKENALHPAADSDVARNVRHRPSRSLPAPIPPAVSSKHGAGTDRS